MSVRNSHTKLYHTDLQRAELHARAEAAGLSPTNFLRFLLGWQFEFQGKRKDLVQTAAGQEVAVAVEKKAAAHPPPAAVADAAGEGGSNDPTQLPETLSFRVIGDDFWQNVDVNLRHAFTHYADSQPLPRMTSGGI